MPHSTTPMRSVTRLLTHSPPAALLFAAARLPAQAKEYRLTHSADTQHPNHIAAVEMAKRIAERTKDEVQLKMHPEQRARRRLPETYRAGPARCRRFRDPVALPARQVRSRLRGRHSFRISSTITTTPTALSTRRRPSG